MQINRFVEQLLNPLQIPITENQFIPFLDRPVPSPPYIVYVVVSEETDGADFDPAGIINVDINVELYSEKRDRIIEDKIAKTLSDNNIDFEKSYVYIESEELHKTTFYISIIKKEL